VSSTEQTAPPSFTRKPKEIAMSLQAKLDAFKADFEAGKPPYSVPRAFI